MMIRDLTFVILLITAITAGALDSSDVLPAHIDSPSLRTGLISGIGQRYTSGGQLLSLTDANSQTFDVKKLMSVEPRVAQLVAVLNQFGQQGLGSALTLGTLHIDIAPSVNYFAPINAYGLTDKWTVAVGVPIIHYRNQIGLSQSGSNLSQIQRQTGGLSAELDSAFKDLNVGLVQSARTELANKGFKPLQDVDTTFVGDVQLVSLYQVFKNSRIALLSKTTLNLPTGPQDDPDDLTDLSDFGQLAINQGAVLTYMLTPRLRISGLANLQYNFADTISKRVPTSADDGLPDASTKENVHQRVGATASIGASTMYWFSKRWSAGLGYDVMTKAGDTYWGSQGRRYDLLETETAQTSMRWRAGLSYDTISSYLAKESFMPAMITYTFSDTVAGVNIARQTINELWLTMFF